MRKSIKKTTVFSERLKCRMKDLGENQSSLARKIKNEQGIVMQRQTISQYINGTSRPDTERLRALCLALDISADYLLGLEMEYFAEEFQGGTYSVSA